MFQTTEPIMRAKRIALLVFLTFLIAAPLAAQPDPPAGGHGMLILGSRGEIYLAHLAMRNVPEHMFQLVLRVDLAASASTRIADRAFVGETADLDTVGANEIYFLDRNHPDNDAEVYTLRPKETFVLTELADGRRASFRGDVVRGHFERAPGSPTLLRDAIFQVDEVVFFQDLRTLNGGEPHPLDAGKWQAFLFGVDGEHWLGHRITLHGAFEQPDNNAFHQVFPVAAATSSQVGFDASARAIPIELDGVDAARLPDGGGRFEATVTGLVDGVPVPLTLEIEPEHYFEELFEVGN